MEYRPGAMVPPSFTAILEDLPISGASIAIFDLHGRQSTVWASDAVALRVEELQFDLGQGPHWRALATGVPVMIPDLGADTDTEWPLFSAASGELGAGALFAFPLTLGAVTVGVVDMYATQPGALSPAEYAIALARCGSVAARATVDAVRGAENDSTLGESAPALRREVHQATGVVLVQLDITASEAFFVLRAHAYSSGRTVLDVAKDVLSGALDFRSLPD